jgi:integrase
MPISRHLAGWLPQFLDKPRPASVRRYEQVLERVGKTCHIQVNPLRFRHTCAVLLYHVMGMDGATVEKLLGVTPRTLAIYVMKPKWMVAKELRDKGW